MRPRGKDTRRARQVMVAIFFLAIIAGLVYIGFALSGEEDRNEVPPATSEQILKTDAYKLTVYKA